MGQSILSLAVVASRVGQKNPTPEVILSPIDSQTA